MKTVLVTGASGLVGSHLCMKLLDKGYHVKRLGRNPAADVPNRYGWDIESQQIDDEALRGVHAIIHLAGANISDGRWSDARKKEIIDSRVDSINLLFDAVKRVKPPLTHFISASAIGFYGAVTKEHVFTELDEPANDFIGTVCQKWEQAASQFETINVKTTVLRTGIVLTSREGPLQKMKLPVALGIGSGLGSGKQYFPWIHVDDLCEMYLFALENESIEGAYNAVGPEHITNLSFTKAIGNVLNRPVFFPNVPRFLLRLIFGQMAQIFLEGSRVSSKKIEDAGFTFKYPTANSALKNLLGKRFN